MGFKIESSIIDGDIEKKSLYGSEEEFDEEEQGDGEKIRSALESLESLGDSYSELGNTEGIKTIFDANDLGKAMINTPTPQKQAAQKEEPQLSPEQIAEIGDDADKLNKELEKRREAMAASIDEFF